MLSLSRRAFVMASTATVLPTRSVFGEIDRLPTLGPGAGPFSWEQPTRQMPPLRLEGLRGEQVIIPPRRDRVTLLHYWATWCPSCLEDLKALEKSRREMPDDIRLITVSIDERGREAVTPYLDAAALTLLPVFLDSAGVTSRRVDRPGTTDVPFILWGLPITYVIGRSNAVLGFIVGQADWLAPDARGFLEYANRH